MSTFKSKYFDSERFGALANEVMKTSLLYFKRENASSLKSDNSPVSAADLANHKVLTEGLTQLLEVPVFSEEDYPDYAVRKDVARYWLIDPLDGTKEFINGVEEFCVLISLMEAGRPVYCSIIVPACDFYYQAELGLGAYRTSEGITKRVSAKPVSTPPRGLVSRFHPDDRDQAVYSQTNISDLVRKGSALKFTALIEGEAEFYFRNRGPHEWDVAAGDLLVREAGGIFAEIDSGVELTYNREETRVSSFIGIAPGVTNPGEWIEMFRKVK